MKSLVTVCLCTGLFFFASNSFAGTKLSGDEIKVALSGKTVEGTNAAGKHFEKMFTEDGAVMIKGNKKGTWHISDEGLFCQELPSGETCMSIEREGDEYNSYVNGEKKSTFVLK